MSFKKQGLTLIELLIVIAVIAVLTTYLLGILNSFLKSRATAKKLDTLQNASTFVLNDINQEFHWAKEITALDSDKITLKAYDINTGLEKSVTYEFLAGQILKNSEVLTSNEVEVTRFKINNLASGSIPLLKFELDLQFVSPKLPKVVYEDSITISLRKLDVEM